jgi:hypothetical protein
MELAAEDLQMERATVEEECKEILAENAWNSRRP